MVTPTPRPPPRSRPPPTAPQLRDAIDHAQAGDKGTGFDPAAAPMEADAEAGGAPPSDAEVAAATRIETHDPPPSPNVVHESGSGYWLGVAAVAAALLVALVWILLHAPP